MALNFSQFGQVIDEPDDFGPLSNLLQSQANVSGASGREAADRADPFHKYKSGVADSLNKVLSNPGEITSSPYYQFAMEQGIEAVKRANKGANSGKYLTDLTKLGTGLAGQQFGTLASLYNTILNGSSVGGAQMLMGGFNRGQDQQAMAAAGRALQNSGGGGSRPSFNLSDMLSRYGMNGAPSGGRGSYGLPSGGGYSGYGPDHTWAGVNANNAYGYFDNGTYSPIQGGGSGYYTVNEPSGYSSFGGDYTSSPYDTSYSEPAYDYGSSSEPTYDYSGEDYGY